MMIETSVQMKVYASRTIKHLSNELTTLIEMDQTSVKQILLLKSDERSVEIIVYTPRQKPKLARIKCLRFFEMIKYLSKTRLRFSTPLQKLQKMKM